MRTGRLLSIALVLLLFGCAAPEAPSVVLYKAAQEEVGGTLRMRSLLVTADRRALGIERRPLAGDVTVRFGVVSPETWVALRADLAAASVLTPDTTSPDSEDPLFQVRARLGRSVVDLRRDPALPMEDDVRGIRDALEGVWDSLTESGTPVGTLEGFLSSPLVRVRGHAVTALLSIRRAAKLPEAVRDASEAALRRHLAVEDDSRIAREIRYALAGGD